VRVGNAASEQLQIDIFGEIADAIFQGFKLGIQPSKRGEALQPVIIEYLTTVWRQPDEGIWEIRGEPSHFVHSKVMAWVAFDRAAA
jgi:GH15 family glucan-1,4-alpha-glucosidase